MSCSCRALSLRVFVQGLAQVHRLEALAAPTALQLRSRPVVQRGHWAAARQSRGLQTTRYRRQEAAAAAAAAPEHEELTQITTSVPSEESSIEEHPEAGSKPEAPTKTKYSKKPKKFKSTKGNKADESSSNPESTQDTQSKPKRGRKPKFQKTTTDEPITSTLPTPTPEPKPHKPKEPWQIQKAALKEKFPEGWKPRKRLSPDALAGIRALNAQFPDVYTTKALASKFEMSPEAIRRILKGKWQPGTDEGEQDREDRWFRRGVQVWEHKAALGIKPPRRWRKEGVVRDPGYHEWSKRAAQREREWEEEEVRKYREYRERIKRQAEGGTR